MVDIDGVSGRAVPPDLRSGSEAGAAHGQDEVSDTMGRAGWLQAGDHGNERWLRESGGGRQEHVATAVVVVGRQIVRAGSKGGSLAVAGDADQGGDGIIVIGLRTVWPHRDTDRLGRT